MSEMKATPLQADFGIEDVLADGSKSFYENVFSTRHVGRVLDFFYFESESFFNACKDRDLSEYRYRSIAETAVFNAFANKPKFTSQCAEIEVGYDTGRMVISVTHSVPKDLANFMPGENAGNEKSVSYRFQKMLEHIQGIADGMIVRYSKRSARIQIMAFLSTDSEATNPSISFHEISEVTMKHAGSAKTPDDAPVALSNARVDDFLQDEKAKEEVAETPTIIEGTSDEPLPEMTVSEPVKEAVDDVTVVSSGSSEIENTDTLSVKGGSFEDSNDEMKLKRLGKGDASLDEAYVIAGGALHDAEDSTPVVVASKSESDVALDSEIIRDVEESAQTLSDNLRSEIVDVAPNLSEEKFNELFKKATQQIRDNYLKTLEHVKAMHELQLQSKAKHHADQLATMNLKVETLKNQLAEAGLHDRTGETTSLVVEKEVKKFDDMLDGYQKSLDQTNVPPQFKEWAKEVLASVMKERGDFNKRIREFETNEKKMIHEISTKETALNEQLRMKEENLRQKDFTLTKTKEALQTALSSIERFKAAQKASTSADAQQKLYTTEKMLVVAKENNDKYMKRVEDLQQRWNAEMTSNATLKKEGQVKQKMVTDLQRKCDQLEEQLAAALGPKNAESRSEAAVQKQMESFKAQIRELQGKLQQTNAQLAKAQTMGMEAARKAASSGNEQQWKLKIEQANKLSKTIKEEADRLRRRFDEAKTSETKLRVEVAQLQTQLKVARGKK